MGKKLPGASIFWRHAIPVAVMIENVRKLPAFRESLLSGYFLPATSSVCGEGFGGGRFAAAHGASLVADF